MDETQREGQAQQRPESDYSAGTFDPTLETNGSEDDVCALGERDDIADSPMPMLQLELISGSQTEKARTPIDSGATYNLINTEIANMLVKERHVQRSALPTFRAVNGNRQKARSSKSGSYFTRRQRIRRTSVLRLFRQPARKPTWIQVGSCATEPVYIKKGTLMATFEFRPQAVYGKECRLGHEPRIGE